MVSKVFILFYSENIEVNMLWRGLISENSESIYRTETSSKIPSIQNTPKQVCYQMLRHPPTFAWINLSPSPETLFPPSGHCSLEAKMWTYFSCLKDGAYYCYCAYVLRIARYSGFLWMVPTNTGIFLRGLKLYGEWRTYQMSLASQKKIGGNHAFFRENQA